MGKRIAQRRPRHHGHALVSTLLAAMLVALGAAGLARWSAGLMQAERHQSQRQAAAQVLLDALERGFLGPGAAAGAPAAAASSAALPDGTLLVLDQSRVHDPAAGDPLRGAHVQWTVSWTSPDGQPQQIRLRTYWAPLRRVH